MQEIPSLYIQLPARYIQHMPPATSRTSASSRWLDALRAFFIVGVGTATGCIVTFYVLGNLFSGQPLSLTPFGSLNTSISGFLALITLPTMFLVIFGVAPALLIAGGIAGIALQFMQALSWYVRILYALLSAGCLAVGAFTIYFINL